MYKNAYVAYLPNLTMVCLCNATADVSEQKMMHSALIWKRKNRIYANMEEWNT